MDHDSAHTTHESSDERTPLIPAKDGAVKERRTPLPKLQIAIVIFLQIGEPLSSQSIYPYINQLIRELDITGGDDRKVGYYAGFIESLFFATEAMTVLHWGRLSDRFGRKPVLLFGLLGSMISILCFGLSRTYWALILSRCLTGLLNGNIGVMKSTMGDLTDSTNRAEAFALLSLVWATGCTLGPLLGGTLYHPYERFPKSFPSKFWEKFPYFLPCLVVALYLLLSFFITLAVFKETVKKPKHHSRLSSEASEQTLNEDAVVSQSESPSIPIRSLFVRRVLLSVFNYAAIAFLNICMYALFPLFLAMPVNIGGMGINPPTIGLALAIYGGVSGLTQTLVFAKVVRYFGPRKTFVYGMFCFIPAFALFPCISLVAKNHGVGWPAWMLVSGILVCLAVSDMGWGSIFMFVTTSSPNKSSLGATNGLAQMCVSIARAIGPAMATSMFSLSVEKNVLGGYGVYALMVLLAICAFFLATRLPEEVWAEEEEEEDTTSL
ncbi:major facilitator superfamily domain-containing protein [Coprinopsis sp. MPI-PUGE-AT-0042]|nr:major facilitator superfamily domain-containing protein [Coprinopsis sp. MPI-PUGE-AT-0042]